jgi:adenosylcobinamide-GDP ribazoletransferase
MALQFLTVSPAFIRRIFTPQELGRATALFPLVGLLVGGVLVGLDAALSWLFPPLLRTALLLAAWLLLSGALHLDGFLDACDGLLGGSTPENRLEIMRDERVGAFALAGGVLLLLVKFAALASLPSFSPALLVAPVLGRWAMAAAIVIFPYARPAGLGRAMKDHAGPPQVLAASVLALTAAVLAGGWQGAAACLAAAALVGLGGRFVLGRIPGLTGDIYGALNEMVEAAVLLVFAARGF